MIQKELLNEVCQAQIELCREHGAEYQPLDFDLKLGVSDNFFSGMLPRNGLRHPQEQGTCGWYLWAGEEMSEAVEFFNSIHVHHLIQRCPDLVKYLALPPGWRFLLAGAYEDVWFDEKLLQA